MQQVEGRISCDYCRKIDGVIQHVAIGTPGRTTVRHVWLHPACERGYLRLIEEA